MVSSMSSAPSNPSDPIFRIEALPAGDGQCLLVHLGTVADPRLVIIDGGPKETWENELKPRLEQIRQERGVRKLHIDAVIVTAWAEEYVDGLLLMAEDFVGKIYSRIEIGSVFLPESQNKTKEKWINFEVNFPQLCRKFNYFPEMYSMPCVFEQPDMVFELIIETDVHAIVEDMVHYVRAFTVSFIGKKARIHSRIISNKYNQYSLSSNISDTMAELMVFSDLKIANFYHNKGSFSFRVNRILVLNDYIRNIIYSRIDIGMIRKMLSGLGHVFMLSREPNFPERLPESCLVTWARYPEIVSYDLISNNTLLFVPKYRMAKIDVDILEFVFLLVLEHRLPSQFLLKPTLYALGRTLALSAPPIYRPEHLVEMVQDLRQKYPGAEPNPLWVAWMHETQADAIAKLTEALPDLLLGGGAPPAA